MTVNINNFRGSNNSFKANLLDKLNNTVEKQKSSLLQHLEAKKSSPKEEQQPEVPREEMYKSGIAGKVYDFTKRATNFGISSRDVNKAAAKLNNSQISVEEYNKLVKDYNFSQENVSQSVGNHVAAGASLGTAAIAEHFIKMEIARDAIGKKSLYTNLKNMKNGEKLQNFIKSKNKRAAALIGIGGILGGFVKMGLMDIDRLGSGRFKVKNKKELSKKEYKQERKALKKKFGDRFRNFYTGAAMGVIAPIATFFSPIAGALGAVAGSNLLNFGTAKTIDKKDKNLKNLADKLIKQNQATNLIAGTAIGLMALRRGQSAHIFEKNLKNVVDSLKDVQLEKIKDDAITPFNKLKDLMLNSEKIKGIRGDWCTPVEERIKKLIDENIFAAKFMQIEKHTELGRALIENCPSTRTIEQAQTYINQMLGEGQYLVSKQLGVGTVAETYLAKEAATGKEVCIKVIKEGIDAAKIQKDKEAFINLVTNGKPLEQLSQEEKFYVQNIENLAEGISREVDLANEMKEAQRLAVHTKVAEVVKPIAVKNNVYIMEKAKGISLDVFKEYIDAKIRLDSKKTECWKKLYPNKKAPEVINFTAEELETLKTKHSWDHMILDGFEQDMKKIKAKSPDFEDFNVTNAQLRKLVRGYIDVQTEQFVKIGRGEKVLHADIHPGNIFINIDALKGKTNEKLFTLIDTGNVVTLSKEQSVRSRYITSYIAKGNVNELSKIIMEDVILPARVTKEQALDILQEGLKQRFFDRKTALNTMTIDNFYALASNILKEHDIIIKDTQLNLNKAKTAGFNSFTDLVENLFKNRFAAEIEEISESGSKVQAALLGSKVMTEAGAMSAKYMQSQKIQEYKNLLKMGFKELKNILFNKGNLSPKSEDYITYKLKQEDGYIDQLAQNFGM